MHEALIQMVRAIALAHDRWRRTIGRRRPLSGKIAVLEEDVQRLEAENALLRARFVRLPVWRRPHYRPHERLEILWHAARYRLSVTARAHAFGLSRQTVLNWRRVAGPRTWSGTLSPSEGQKKRAFLHNLSPRQLHASTQVGTSVHIGFIVCARHEDQEVTRTRLTPSMAGA